LWCCPVAIGFHSPSLSYDSAAFLSAHLEQLSTGRFLPALFVSASKVKFILIDIIGVSPNGSTQLCATNRPIVPTPGDYGDGEIG
jgi:hypothetical protein